jgi:hypothetical protein
MVFCFSETRPYLKFTFPASFFVPAKAGIQVFPFPLGPRFAYSAEAASRRPGAGTKGKGGLK